MGMWYKLDMEVKNTEIDDAEFEKIKGVFKKEWGHAGFTKSAQKNGQSIAVFSGSGCLCGAESEHEAHERIRNEIKRAIGKCEVKTEWTNVEERSNRRPSERFRD